MKKIIKVLALLGVLAMVVTGCSLDSPGSNAPESNGGSESGDVKVGISISTLNNPFFIDMLEGAEAAAEAAGYTLISTDAQNDTSRQISGIEDMLQQDIDLLIINPTDSDGIVSAVESANAAGIPVITVDRVSNGGEVIAHVASDNVVGGEMAAQFIVDELGGSGKVIELEGISGATSARDRGQGFHNVMGENDDMEVLASQAADFDRVQGLTVTENLLQRHPDVEAIFAHNDEMALGALEALSAAGLSDQVIVVGFDAIDDAIESIEGGELTATIAQQPKLISERAMEAVAKVINGEDVDAVIPVELQLVQK